MISSAGPLRIAVDARCLSADTVGIGRYTSSLLHKLLKTSHGDEIIWFLYSHQPLKISFESYPNVHVKSLQLKGGMLSTSVAQLFFPLWAIRDKVNFFWSPRHHLPLLLPKSIYKILTIHDFVWKNAPKTMRLTGRILETLLMPLSIRLADKIISVSDSTHKQMRSYYPGEYAKSRLIFQGISQPSHCNIVSISNREENYEFLFVGTLEPRKNLPRLLSAYKRVVASDIKSTLLIVGGNGWGNESIAELVKEFSLEDRVKIYGYVSDEKLFELYQRSYVLVMPSLYEGFGLPLLEAMQFGVPVITSKVSSMPEVAGAGGILVDPFSVDEIADAMIRLISDRDLRDALGQQALEHCKKFSWDKAADETLALFYECIIEN